MVETETAVEMGRVVPGVERAAGMGGVGMYE